jgi:hypothetical protein
MMKSWDWLKSILVTLLHQVWTSLHMQFSKIDVIGHLLAQVRASSSKSVIGCICLVFHDRSMASFSRVSFRASELSYLYNVHFI